MKMIRLEHDMFGGAFRSDVTVECYNLNMSGKLSPFSIRVCLVNRSPVYDSKPINAADQDAIIIGKIFNVIPGCIMPKTSDVTEEKSEFRDDFQGFISV